MTSVLILGGARSGKSRYAERLLMSNGAVVYLATGRPATPDDPEWATRVATHRERRPAGWHTVESWDVTGVLRDLACRAAPPAVLVDCLGTWLARVVDHADAWDHPVRAEQAVADRVPDLAAAVTRYPGDLALVSNETGLGVVPATPAGRMFRDELGRLNRVVADACDRVVLVVAGRVLDLTGAERVDP